MMKTTKKTPRTQIENTICKETTGTFKWALIPFVLLLIAGSINTSHAQDLITFKDGTEINVKVIEVTMSYIRYKKEDTPESQIYSVPSENVFRIVYENGTTKIIGNDTVKKEEMPVNTIPPKEERIRYGGPRVGFTIIGEGTTAEYLNEIGKRPFISQIGWQFETHLFSVNNGTQGLLEWVILVGGLEQGLFLPSASLLFGIRDGNQGLEFGVGPNVSLSGVGMALAIGGSIKRGDINFPINLAFVPSYGKQQYDELTGENTIVKTGFRISLLAGFNTKVHN